MKKAFLLLSFVGSSLLAGAQLTLTGTSYTQNFNSIGGGLPTGWSGYTGASSSAAGAVATFNSSTTYGIYADTISCAVAIVFNDGYKNYPSANAATKDMICADQKTVTDRAFGLRQKGGTAPAYDPGAAFVLKLANTTGRTGFSASFKLQSLDTTSPRTSTWAVDYGFGTAPTTFTAATATGTLTTGGLTFSNNTINVNFGSALDNQTSQVWIRIVSLTSSTGSGNRASTAIDDFNLTWTGGGVGVEDINKSSAAALSVLGTPSANQVAFGYNFNDNGNYRLVITDLAGKVISNNEVAVNGGSSITLSNLNLSNGLYIARMTNGVQSAFAKFVVQ